MQGGLNPHLWYWMFLMALAETSRPGEEFRSSVLLLSSGGAVWLLSWLFCTKGGGCIDHWMLPQLCSPCYHLPLPSPDCSVCQSRFPQSVFLLLFQYLKKRRKVASCYSNCGSSRHVLHRGTTSDLSFTLKESFYSLVTNLREVRLGHPKLGNGFLRYHP